MATKTGPIRKQMGPLKYGVTKYIQQGQDLLTHTDSVEHENVKSHQGKLQLARDLLSNAANRLHLLLF